MSKCRISALIVLNLYIIIIIINIIKLQTRSSSAFLPHVSSHIFFTVKASIVKQFIYENVNTSNCNCEKITK